jgi:hypothetical protein
MSLPSHAGDGITDATLVVALPSLVGDCDAEATLVMV